MKETKKAVTPYHASIAILAAIAAIVSLIEAVLIIAGFLSPMSSYSPGNLIFVLANLALLVYVGYVSAPDGLLRAARNGAIVAFSRVVMTCIGATVGSAVFGKAVLGIPAPNAIPFGLVLVLIIIENTVLGTAIAVISAFVAGKLGGKQNRA